MPNVAHRENRDFRAIRRFAGFCLAVALVGGVGRMAAVTPAEPETAARATPPTEIPPGKLVSPAKDLKYVGVGGCSAAACHGGPLTSNPARMWNCSYTIWATQEPLELAENRSMKSADRGRLIDKHNRAYAVLYDGRAKRMVQLLDHLPDADAAQPYKDARCIACHSVPRDPATVPISILADGVGCELCHGPAKNWLARHTEKQWIESYHAGKAAPLPDMNDTRGLLSRARICAGCHVGSPGDDGQLTRDVNHDLIAAGHPRLDFSFHAYLGVMPKHWSDIAVKNLPENVGQGGQAHFAHKASQNEPVPAAIQPGFKADRETHAEAWAIGQVVAAEAALKLLAHRAAMDDKVSACPWPEFSEYDCFACHHRLESKFPSPRQKSAEGRSGPNRVGSLPWGTWYFPEVRFLIESEPLGKWPEDFGRPLAELSAAMNGSIATVDRKQVQALAKRAAEAMHRLADRLAEATLDRATVDRLLLRASDADFAPRDWDEAAQRLLTLDALWDAHRFFQSQLGVEPGKDEQAVSDALETIRQGLQFPVMDTKNESPAEAQRPNANPHFDSPARFDPEAIRADAFQPAFARIRGLLSTKDRK